MSVKYEGSVVGKQRKTTTEPRVRHKTRVAEPFSRWISRLPFQPSFGQNKDFWAFNSRETEQACDECLVEQSELVVTSGKRGRFEIKVTRHDPRPASDQCYLYPFRTLLPQPYRYTVSRLYLTALGVISDICFNLNRQCCYQATVASKHIMILLSAIPHMPISNVG